MEIKNSHGGFQGKSIAEKIEVELDREFKEFREWMDTPTSDDADKYGTFGTCEGLAIALGILRSSSQEHEMDLAEERYNANKNATEGVIGVEPGAFPGAFPGDDEEGA